MNRFTYLIAMLAVLYGVVSGLMGAGDGPRRPEPEISPPSHRPPLQQPRQAAPRGPTIKIDVGAKGSSTGTAFAITHDGWWLTARHVAHGCDAIWLQTAPRKGWRVLDVHLHPNADLALLRTRTGRAPLGLARAMPGRGQDGFSLGYPQGRPGDVHARVLGQARLKSVGRYRIDEPILAWAEVTRRPADLSALGGLSGGPMLDDQGRVVGVLVASSKRRGRVMTTAPSSIWELLAQFPEAQPNPGALSRSIDDRSFTTLGKTLRREMTIAKVLCKVKQTRRRP
ncbi:MAG: trypsin-like peptidase domain-containing protein [Alphaproteobacteria bacterium]